MEPITSWKKLGLGVLCLAFSAFAADGDETKDRVPDGHPRFTCGDRAFQFSLPPGLLEGLPHPSSLVGRPKPVPVVRIFPPPRLPQYSLEETRAFFRRIFPDVPDDVIAALANPAPSPDPYRRKFEDELAEALRGDVPRPDFVHLAFFKEVEGRMLQASLGWATAGDPYLKRAADALFARTREPEGYARVDLRSGEAVEFGFPLGPTEKLEQSPFSIVFNEKVRVDQEPLIAGLHVVRLSAGDLPEPGTDPVPFPVTDKEWVDDTYRRTKSIHMSLHPLMVRVSVVDASKPDRIVDYRKTLMPRLF